MTAKQKLYPGSSAKYLPYTGNAKNIATRGEELAASFLTKNDYQLLARNFRAGRNGEIDIIAMSPDETVVFVEVKTRRQDQEVFGIPELGFEAVGYRKQRKILEVSQIFMSIATFTLRRWRYDVIVVILPHAEDQRPHITHVENAFV